jgi:uncharacterized membrane protein YfcA
VEVGLIVWPVSLFAFTLIIGIIAPISGVGGGVLFVPLTAAFFPFSLDFIRGTGLIMALTSGLSSVPQLAMKGLASLKIMAPLVVVSIGTSILGGMLGLWITGHLPSGEYYIEIALGFVLFVIFGVLLLSKRVEFPEVTKIDAISRRLGLKGSWYEPSLDKVVDYKVTNMLVALPFFGVVGLLAGMFGMGAGWANVPALNLIMGAPIKVATSTSMAIVSVNDAAASWTYLAGGAVLPMIVIPCVVGITVGARIGARVATRVKSRYVTYLVMGVMLIAAILDLEKGLSGLGLIPTFF